MDSTKVKFTTIDEYIATFPQDLQKTLKDLRKTILEEAPDATETISYQMPTFKLNGTYLIYFAAWKDHIAVYPGTSAMEEIQELADYRTGKGTFQFPLASPLPFDLIRKIVRVRIKETLERKAKSGYK
jgi:uncharacterized protein YdhG (YjbR/CyaY superfamily)